MTTEEKLMITRNWCHSADIFDKSKNSYGMVFFTGTSSVPSFTDRFVRVESVIDEMFHMVRDNVWNVVMVIVI